MTTDTTTPAGRTVRVRMVTDQGHHVFVDVPAEWVSIHHRGFNKMIPWVGSPYDQTS